MIKQKCVSKLSCFISNKDGNFKKLVNQLWTWCDVKIIDRSASLVIPEFVRDRSDITCSYSTNKMSKYRIVMVRHGESEWNQLNLFCGWYDAGLSDKGMLYLCIFMKYQNLSTVKVKRSS